ncbi:MAG: WD40 repeat domain-containing protein, partial [Chloroflexi bacterium]|nr:WD40 repeat domain-containing protein [Chloroflexota bacterium]
MQRMILAICLFAVGLLLGCARSDAPPPPTAAPPTATLDYQAIYPASVERPPTASDSLAMQIDAGEAIMRLGLGQPDDVVIAASGNLLLVGINQMLLGIDPSRFELRWQRQYEADIRDVAISPDGSLAALIVGQTQLHLINTESVEGQHILRFRDRALRAVAFSSNSRTVALAGLERFSLIDASDGALLWTQRQSSGGAFSMAFSPDNRLLAMTLSHGAFQIVDAATGNLLVNRVDFSGTLLGPVSWSADGRVVSYGRSVPGVLVEYD